MPNLDRVASVWEDLDKSYISLGNGATKAQFLRKLLANGKFEAVKSLLGKLAGDISTEEDNMNFSSLQKVMLGLMTVYHQIPDDLDCINDFVLHSLNGKPRVGDFGYLLSLINVAQVFVPPKVSFESSYCGMDVVTSDEVHIVEKEGDGVLIFKSKSDIRSCVPGDSVFKQRALEVMQSKEPTFSTIFISNLLQLGKKSVKTIGKKKCLVYNQVSAEVILLD